MNHKKWEAVAIIIYINRHSPILQQKKEEFYRRIPQYYIQKAVQNTIDRSLYSRFNDSLPHNKS